VLAVISTAGSGSIQDAAFLLEQFKAYEDKCGRPSRRRLVRPTTATLASSLHMGKLADAIVPVKPEEAETHKKLVEGAVLAGWASVAAPNAPRVERDRRQERSG